MTENIFKQNFDMHQAFEFPYFVTQLRRLVTTSNNELIFFLLSFNNLFMTS
jgi:hypothetical protein